MASFNDTLQQLVNKDYDELLNLAKGSIIEVWDACKEIDPDHEGVLMVTCLILSAIGADGQLSALEKKFVGDLMGLNADQIEGLIKSYDPKMAELTDKFADSLSDDQKAATLLLVAAVAACDETISREENAFLVKILQ